MDEIFVFLIFWYQYTLLLQIIQKHFWKVLRNLAVAVYAWLYPSPLPPCPLKGVIINLKFLIVLLSM